MSLQQEGSMAVYQAYQRLEPDAYRERVRFYDENCQLFASLSAAERMSVLLDYHGALFEIGKYQRFLDGVDSLIEYVVIENVGGYSNDLFCDLLFKKAASYYNLWQLRDCETITSQLLRIDADYPDAQALLYQCRLRCDRRWYQVTKAVSVLTFFFGAVGLLMSSLVVEPFYPAYYSWAHGLSVGMLVGCVVLLVGNELTIKLAALLDVRRHIAPK
jgi:hypothetical protein